MAKKVEIEVEIDSEGRVQFHVKGRKGESCLEFLELFEKSLGRVDSKDYTSEYYEQKVVNVVTQKRDVRRKP